MAHFLTMIRSSLRTAPREDNAQDKKWAKDPGAIHGLTAEDGMVALRSVTASYWAEVDRVPCKRGFMIEREHDPA
jgi:hypothetical protein